MLFISAACCHWLMRLRVNDIFLNETTQVLRLYRAKKYPSRLMPDKPFNPMNNTTYFVTK